MPYARPTLTALRDQAISDITTSNVPGLAGLLRNAVLRVLAFVTAGLTYLLYGYLDWIAHQAVPFTATDEYLEAWAALKGVYRKEANASIGQALFTGSVSGTVLPRLSTLTRIDGVPCFTNIDGTVDGSGNLLVPIESAILGAATNCPDGTPIGIDSPIPGINSGGVTSGPMTGGADQETDDELRTRMLTAYANPPQGGSQSDYIEWATSVPGCTRAWIVPGGMGAGTVSVYPMFDDNAFNGFPQGTNGCASEEARGPTATGDQLAVAEYIWPRQPIPALVYVIAPVAFHIPVTLYNFAPNDSDVIAQVQLSLTDMFVARGTIGGTIYPSDVAEAVSATPGVDHFTLYYPTTPMSRAGGGFADARDIHRNAVKPPPTYSASDYLWQFQKLLPRGRVWHRGWGTVQAEGLLTLMPTWARLDARAGNLLTDAFPCTTDELLPEWEATLGLPDPCTGPLPTIQQRVLAVCAKFSNTGGQSMQYFIDLAETLGFKITITTYSVFRTGLSRIGDPLNAPAFAFAWGVTLVIDPGPPPSPKPIYFRTGASGVGEPLMYWDDELMRCMFEALKPAHTSIIWIS